MSIKLRLTILNFLQFFLWGSWLTSIGVYLGKTLQFSGGQIGSVFATLGIASVIMPGILGIIADKWLNAEKLYGICHILGGLSLFWLAQITDPTLFVSVILINSLFYMPTIALCYSISYAILSQRGQNVIDAFPPIRVWGTIGFIIAMWAVDLLGWTDSNIQLYLGGVASVVLGIYSFTMPTIPTNQSKEVSLYKALGLDALVIFKDRNMVLFFIFAILLGASLQITNAFGQDFLRSFETMEQYRDSFAVLHPGILASLSQASETVFILAIPFFLHRFGIKKVMLISMIAWALRFALFALGNPGQGLILLIISMIVYGMAFDFFNISGSLYVEKQTNANIRSSAQGLFIMATNGLGTILGSKISGFVVDLNTTDTFRNWPNIWWTFAAYSIIIAVVFALVFRYKHVAEPTLAKSTH